MTEKRLLLELARPFGEESQFVSGLELTSDVSCLQGYKQFTCRYNFPYCDSETGEISMACPEECIYFHTSCGLSAKECSSKFFDFMMEESASCEFAPVVESEEEEAEEE